MKPSGEDPPLRYFTPREANSMLGEVKDLLGEATGLMSEIEELIARSKRTTGAPDTELARRVESRKARLVDRVEQIRGRGVEVKALKSGLLDFPALRNGKAVYLCWQVGEAAVEWWHPMHTGFAGRRRIDEEPATWEWRN